MIGKLKQWEDLYQTKRCNFDRDQYFVYHDTTGMYLPVWVGHIYHFGTEIEIETFSVNYYNRVIYQKVNDSEFKMYDCWFEYIQDHDKKETPYEFFSDDDLRIII